MKTEYTISQIAEKLHITTNKILFPFFPLELSLGKYSPDRIGIGNLAKRIFSVWRRFCFIARWD